LKSFAIFKVRDDRAATVVSFDAQLVKPVVGEVFEFFSIEVLAEGFLDALSRRISAGVQDPPVGVGPFVSQQDIPLGVAIKTHALHEVFDGPWTILDENLHGFDITKASPSVVCVLLVGTEAVFGVDHTGDSPLGIMSGTFMGFTFADEGDLEGWWAFG
jgi:hypothetical protein